VPIHAVHHVVRCKEEWKTLDQARLIQVLAIQIQIGKVDDGDRRQPVAVVYAEDQARIIRVVEIPAKENVAVLRAKGDRGTMAAALLGRP